MAGAPGADVKEPATPAGDAVGKPSDPLSALKGTAAAGAGADEGTETGDEGAGGAGKKKKGFKNRKP